MGAYKADVDQELCCLPKDQVPPTTLYDRQSQVHLKWADRKSRDQEMSLLVTCFSCMCYCCR